MKIKNSKEYREIYQKWMDKQSEINATEDLLSELEKQATELKQQLDNYKCQKHG